MGRSRKKILRLAALGGLIAWLLNRRRAKAEPEGTWRDLTGPDGAPAREH